MALYYEDDADLFTSGPESGAFSSGAFDPEEIHKRIEELDERLSCAVCLSRFKQPRLLDCNHSFCTDCLKKILAKRQIDLEHPVGEFSGINLVCMLIVEYVKMADHSSSLCRSIYTKNHFNFSRFSCSY